MSKTSSPSCSCRMVRYGALNSDSMDTVAWCMDCPCLDCQTERWQDTTPSNSCKLLTNLQACYPRRYATIDSHTFNRVPQTMIKHCYPCRKVEGEPWKVLAYPHCDGRCSCGHMSEHCQDRNQTSTTMTCQTPYTDPRINPYGLPATTYDVKRRADWLSVYINKHMQSD